MQEGIPPARLAASATSALPPARWWLCRAIGVRKQLEDLEVQVGVLRPLTVCVWWWCCCCCCCGGGGGGRLGRC